MVKVTGCPGLTAATTPSTVVSLPSTVVTCGTTTAGVGVKTTTLVTSPPPTVVTPVSTCLRISVETSTVGTAMTTGGGVLINVTVFSPTTVVITVGTPGLPIVLGSSIVAGSLGRIVS